MRARLQVGQQSTGSLACAVLPLPLSSRTLNHLADLIRRHRNQHRSRWRRLDPGRQALLAPAHLRNGDTYTRLAAGLTVGATAWRYVQEAVDSCGLTGTAGLGGQHRITTQQPRAWKILTKLRCCPRRATAIVQAIRVLQRIEANRYAG
ncbi:hypothetical protein AB0K20_29960 [Micromonospora matsumotoense]|uniref:hypothetical protein n=1 Tax=Micromonospora matsumotoense TaxID=121616 RepID=UPI003437C070